MSLAWEGASAEENASGLRAGQSAESDRHISHEPKGLWAQALDSVALALVDKLRRFEPRLQRAKSRFRIPVCPR